jgi:hypothetical protein
MSEQKILLISGRKQSGKDSAANWLAGYLLKKAGIIKYYELDEQGKLLINHKFVDPETNQEVEELGLLDLERKDIEFAEQASRSIWPHIKNEKFGNLLKDVLITVFGLNREEIYGSDEDKNKLSPIKWENVYRILPHLKPKTEKKEKKSLKDKMVEARSEGLEITTTELKVKESEPVQPEFLTNREVMEIFGTDICRSLYNLCWVEPLFKQITLQGYPLVVISDCRNQDEIEYARALGARVIRLTRNPHNGGHSIETALDNYEGFDYVIDNENMTQEEKGVALVNKLLEWGWI